MKNYAFIPGDPWAVCDRCGLTYRFSNTRKEWTGLRVCLKCFEERHPQEYVRGIPDKRAVKDARPEPPDQFVTIIWSEDEAALQWPGTLFPGVIMEYMGDGWFTGWFVVPWFSDGGWMLYANSLDGQIYQTNFFPALGGYTVTATLDYEIDDPASTVSLKYQASDGGVLSGWTDYIVPFTAPFAEIRFGIFVDMVNPYELWVNDLTVQVTI